MTMVALSVHSSLSPVSTIKKFLKTQASSTLRSPSTPTEKSRLPTHLIYEIARYCSLRDIAQVSLCSHRMRNLLAPLLYASVDLKTNRHCKNTLIALSKSSDLAQYVRRLAVRTNNLEWTDKGGEIDEVLISNLIGRIAASGSLNSLEAFEWDGLEMPHDDLWLALRTSCPYLKRISTIVGDEPLNASSALWDFEDLRQISLKAKSPSLDWLSEGLPKPEKLPRKFWAMLLERCPRLEDLTLGGPAPSPRLFDIRHVTSGRWPRLQRIILGDMVLLSPERGDAQARETARAFQEFFRIHRTLRHVGLEHAAGSAFWPGGFDWGSIGVGVAQLPPSKSMTMFSGHDVRDDDEDVVLPHLESFSGPLRYVKTLPPRTRKGLRSLRLTSLHHTLSAVGPTCNVVRDMDYLEELGVWIDLSFGSSGMASGSKARRGSLDSIGRGAGGVGGLDGEDAHVLKALLAACPETLRHLDVACFTRPMSSIKDFSSALSHAAPPSLNSFHLTKVHRSSGDEDLLKGATRLVSENPGLRHVVLRATQDSWFCSGTSSGGTGRVKALGVYEVLDGVVRDYPSFTSASTSSPSSGSPVSSVESEAVSPSSPIPTGPMTRTLMAHEWGQRVLTGKDYTRHFVHRLSEKTIVKGHRRRTSGASNISVAASTTGAGLSPRSSISSATGSLHGYRHGSSHGHGHGYGIARPSSATGLNSMSMTMSNSGNIHRRPSSTTHGHKHSESYSSISSLGYGRRYSTERAVTWADQVQEGECTLGRNGSGSSGATSDESSNAGNAQLSYLQARRRSREMSIDEGFVLI